jgi:isopentenyl diphosphate isomerase/L-lactate dehydrogenase-like FMN-dependent dehydrogenase
MQDSADDFQTLHEIVRKARQNLDQNNWDYLAGGTETETTLKRNRQGLDSIAFRPRVLRDVSAVDASTSAFGRRLRLPVLIAPVGALETFGEGGGATVAAAAGDFGVPHMLSSVCDPGLEGVAQAAAATMRMFQLYVRGDEAFVDDYVRRAIAAGYTAFCLTVDTAIYSRRERDIAKRHTTAGRRRASGATFQAALDWSTVKRIKDRFDIPLILKGIATAEDARIALEHRVDGIYISNHGGRQLDHGRGSIEVLPEIVQAVAGKAMVIVDGGFYRGTDIVKALAMGADLVGLGRMQCYGLAAAGRRGIVRTLELLEDEVKRCLGLLGVTAYGQLDASYLHAATPAYAPGVHSAFPLLDLAPYRY